MFVLGPSQEQELSDRYQWRSSLNAVSKRHENRLKSSDTELIAGVDEAGIGPLAGPVVAAAVILKKNSKLPGLDDSKKLTHKQREELFGLILDSSESIGIGIVDNLTIDRINILRASLKAMAQAVESLDVRPNHLIVDGIRTIPGINIAQTSIKRGDSLASSISAASIIAKVVRDTIMDSYSSLYPNHAFEEHRGYGTAKHMRLLSKFGPTPIHRVSFEPVRAAFIERGFLFF
jgi:ribonuclease HII